MENYIIKPKRLFFLSYLLMGLFMTGCSILCFIESIDLIEKIALGLSIIFFGLVTLVFLIKFIRLKPELIANEDGLYYNDIFISWEIIESFSIIPFVENRALIAINLNNFDKVKSQLPFFNRTLFLLNKVFGDESLKINLIGTNLKPEVVLKKLNGYLNCYKSKE